LKYSWGVKKLNLFLELILKIQQAARTEKESSADKMSNVALLPSSVPAQAQLD
jgi:hypothetical protein